jgi:hypothetical protein
VQRTKTRVRISRLLLHDLHGGMRARIIDHEHNKKRASRHAMAPREAQAQLRLFAARACCRCRPGPASSFRTTKGTIKRAPRSRSKKKRF